MLPSAVLTMVTSSWTTPYPRLIAASVSEVDRPPGAEFGRERDWGAAHDAAVSGPQPASTQPAPTPAAPQAFVLGEHS